MFARQWGKIRAAICASSSGQDSVGAGISNPMTDNSFTHIAILGAGAWGTALALAAHAAGRKTTEVTP